MKFECKNCGNEEIWEKEPESRKCTECGGVLVKQKTEVVNLNDESYDTYIGRGGKGQKHMLNTEVGERGWLGNPFKLKKDGGHYTRKESIEEFKDAFYKKIQNNTEFRKEVDKLKGENLGCYCKPKPCHGDVIKEYFEYKNMLKKGDFCE